jgi:hypothetical protein
MLNCPLISLEHDVLFLSLPVELGIVYVWINDYNYDQLVLLIVCYDRSPINLNFGILFIKDFVYCSCILSNSKIWKFNPNFKC